MDQKWILNLCKIKNHSLWVQERIFAEYISVDLMRLPSRHVLIFDFPIFVFRENPLNEISGLDIALMWLLTSLLVLSLLALSL